MPLAIERRCDIFAPHNAPLTVTPVRTVQEDHDAEEGYRAMTSSLMQEQQGAKDLVEVANRLQDRFFCVYLHNPSVKVQAVDDDNRGLATPGLHLLPAARRAGDGCGPNQAVW